MLLPGPDPREPSPVTWPIWVPALFVTMMILVIGGLSTYLAFRMDTLLPRVGDMIVFSPAPPDGDPWRLKVNAAAVKGRDAAAAPCLFDPNVITAQGGSLIIELRETASPPRFHLPRFHLHWAGHHTATGENDCGSAADIVLDLHEVQTLANAAGGFGIRPRTLR